MIDWMRLPANGSVFDREYFSDCLYDVSKTSDEELLSYIAQDHIPLDTWSEEMWMAICEELERRMERPDFVALRALYVMGLTDG